ncbi:glycosyl transferase family 39 [Roseomonas sp. 18066]|uniref:glycosyl transferase family 39 n=1 Tax=Roseomonas sp. 18066 TaxID=2681412 RepID=UPI001F3440C2|nr:glycosyl transferase family 39 [Roseomonas sp. 18066]
MTKISALLVAAGLAIAPGLASAADLYDNTNNASAIGSPFAYSMPVTQSADARLPLRVGNSAGASTAALTEEPVATSQARGPGLPLVVGNAASAFGGPGTGPRSTRG